MIHEVLLALVGHTGGLVEETKDGFELSGQVDFLSEAEKRLVERIIQVGYLCKCLDDFIKTVRQRHFAHPAVSGPKPTVADEKPIGHYTYGMSLRVEAYLREYKTRVIGLETHVLSEPLLPLTVFSSTLEDDRCTLSALRRLTSRASQLNGGELLDLLSDAVTNHMGIGSIHRCFCSLLEGAGQILINQLVAWLVYGRLVDPDKEFFIERSDGQESKSAPGTAMYGGAIDDLSGDIGTAAAQREWQSLFSLRPDKVPQKLMSLDVANKVLFVGKAVRVLIRSGRWVSSTGTAAAGLGKMTGGGAVNPDNLQKEIDALRNSFSAKSPTYVVQRAVETIRIHASTQLWELVVSEAELVQHLTALKGFYLLGYGAFYQTFLEASRHLLSQPPQIRGNIGPEAELSQGPWAAAMSEHKVVSDRFAFSSALAWGGATPSSAVGGAAKNTSLEKILASRFAIHFPITGLKGREMEASLWFKHLELSYDIPWPLPLVLTQHSIERYNRLFRLLLGYRHAYQELHYMTLPKAKPFAWALRAQLSYFTSQVLLYFQQDVIEVAFQRLLDAIEVSKEFDEVVVAHESFLTSATANCFLQAPDLHHALQNVLQIVASFCRLKFDDVLKSVSEPASWQAAQAARKVLEIEAAQNSEMCRLRMEFVVIVRSVLKMMASMHRQGMHTLLSQLLLRLDYNGYFSRESHD